MLEKLDIMDRKIDDIGHVVVELKAINERNGKTLDAMNLLLGKVGSRYQWEEKTSESGIQIAGGPTTITKTGFILGVTALPTANGIAFVFALQDEVSKKFALLSPDLIRPVP